MTIAVIGLGSNIGQLDLQINQAIMGLGQIGKLVARSRIFHTKPWGVVNQPDFYNAVAGIDVEVSSYELLNLLQQLEKELGRKPTYKWGPRVIDLDIIFYGTDAVNTSTLKIPHPYWYKRAFVIIPLMDLSLDFAKLLAFVPKNDTDAIQPVKDSASFLDRKYTDQLAKMFDKVLIPVNKLLIEKIDA